MSAVIFKRVTSWHLHHHHHHHPFIAFFSLMQWCKVFHDCSQPFPASTSSSLRPRPTTEVMYLKNKGIMWKYLKRFQALPIQPFIHLNLSTGTQRANGICGVGGLVQRPLYTMSVQSECDVINNDQPVHLQSTPAPYSRVQHAICHVCACGSTIGVTSN